MSDAERLNDVLRRDHPGVFRCLSPLGLRAAFPRGIPFQAAEAAGAPIDATIGQLTDGDGHPLPLPALEQSVAGLDPAETFLYAPVDGPRPLRERWLAHQRAAGASDAQVSLPVVTHGLTHSLSLAATLFADPDTDVIVPTPAWENYDLLFQFHAGARVVRYALHERGRFTTSGLERALAGLGGRKALVVLNFPSNPSGWWPGVHEAREVVDLLVAAPGPLAVAIDDAYQGWVYEPGLHARSLFWDLAERADRDRLVALKCDAATKELVFFSSRIGFLTATVSGAAADALASKLKCAIRGTVGPASGPALAMTLAALRDPGTPAAFEARRALMADRYRTLKDALGRLDGRASPAPFNSAFFVLVELTGGLRAEDLRRRLLADHGVGTVAFPEENALRLAYCSIHRDRLGPLVDALVAVTS